LSFPRSAWTALASEVAPYSKPGATHSPSLDPHLGEISDRVIGHIPRGVISGALASACGRRWPIGAARWPMCPWDSRGDRLRCGVTVCGLVGDMFFEFVTNWHSLGKMPWIVQGCLDR
jgi:hypothetical protein